MAKRPSQYEVLYLQERAKRWAIEEELEKLSSILDILVSRTATIKSLESRLEYVENEVSSSSSS